MEIKFNAEIEARLKEITNGPVNHDPPSRTEGQCNRCINTTHFGNCKAYPVGIPKDIYYDDFEHTKPYPGDNGIQFEAFES